jgi:Domain of unknown function (DUF4398)
MPHKKLVSVALIGWLTTACGASYPEPKEAEIQTEGAVRGAQEVGADKDPQATLHLKYASDQIAEAKRQIASGDNHRAEMLLMRAKSDAELALMLAKARTEKNDAQKAQDEVAEMRRKLGKGVAQ